MWAEIKTDQKEMKTAINSIRYELEKTIKNRVKDALASVSQRAQDLREELSIKIQETQLGLQAATTSHDTRTRSPREEIGDTTKDLHEKLNRRIQGIQV